MHDFTRKLLTEWRKLALPFDGETFVVAVSGGADSLSLALALDDLRSRKKLNLRFVIAHFNHRLRGAESDADEQFVKDFAAKYDFELALGNAENLPAEKGNLEQTARVARYGFLRETAGNLRARGVLTAHTINDQAETFLLNLLRGSGIEGLSAMKTVRHLNAEREQQINARNLSVAPETDLKENDQSEIQSPKSEIRLIRPLLTWAKRGDTEQFCQDRQIEFRYDSMNEDLAFKRVRIRRVLLPLLQDFNPKIVEILAATAGLLRDEFAERAEDSRVDWPEIESEQLSLKKLKSLSTAVRRKVLRSWLEKRRGDLRQINLKHIEAIERLILSEKSGRAVEIPHGAAIFKKNGKLFWQKNRSIKVGETDAGEL